jgi:hypothetical protein
MNKVNLVSIWSARGFTLSVPAVRILVKESKETNIAAADKAKSNGTSNTTISEQLAADLVTQVAARKNIFGLEAPEIVTIGAKEIPKFLYNPNKKLFEKCVLIICYVLIFPFNFTPEYKHQIGRLLEQHSKRLKL